MSLKNKRVLITAGPTWVPIDIVRVISNIATGETGILLAEKLLKKGAKVTLLLGPVNTCCIERRARVINFRFFDELKSCLKKELRARRYDIVVHSAAVSDYKPVHALRSKIRSSKKSWNIKLVQAPKLIEDLKTMQPGLRVAGFKFEPDLTHNALIKSGEKLLNNAGLDWVVANTNKNQSYCAYIIDNKRAISGPWRSKNDLADALVGCLCNPCAIARVPADAGFR
ncbi:MAG: phosphopantothenoylcysteine decarboxylase [Candidatus Omnitrophota bacterium]